MSPVHPMSAMTEHAWSVAWDGEQERVDQIRSQRGSWLPNVVELRGWGAVRWTSGRPRHAAETGQAVAETFVVVDPEHRQVRDSLPDLLRDPAPMGEFAGFTIHRETALGAAVGAAAGAVLGAAVMGLTSLSVVSALVLLVVLVGLGVAGGAMVVRQLGARARARAITDNARIRIVTGRYAPGAWARLVTAATLLEAPVPSPAGGPVGSGAPDSQATDAVHHAIWEAAGLLLGSSDHTGVEVLADGVERLAQAHRA